LKLRQYMRWCSFKLGTVLQIKFEVKHNSRENKVVIGLFIVE